MTPNSPKTKVDLDKKSGQLNSSPTANKIPSNEETIAEWLPPHQNQQNEILDIENFVSNDSSDFYNETNVGNELLSGDEIVHEQDYDRDVESDDNRFSVTSFSSFFLRFSAVKRNGTKKKKKKKKTKNIINQNELHSNQKDLDNNPDEEDHENNINNGNLSNDEYNTDVDDANNGDEILSMDGDDSSDSDDRSVSSVFSTFSSFLRGRKKKKNEKKLKSQGSFKDEPESELKKNNSISFFFRRKSSLNIQDSSQPKIKSIQKNQSSDSLNQMDQPKLELVLQSQKNEKSNNLINPSAYNSANDSEVSVQSKNSRGSMKILQLFRSSKTNNQEQSTRTTKKHKFKWLFKNIEKTTTPIAQNEASEKCFFEGKAGDVILQRYTIKDILGEGTFGRVFECFDKKYNEEVAVKIICRSEKYRKLAKIEAQTLTEITNHAAASERCVQLLNAFDHEGFPCLVFEKLSLSLFALLEMNRFAPLPIRSIQTIGLQLFESVAAIHSMELIHTDLKPENILFVYDGLQIEKCPIDEGFIHIPKRLDVKLIDFGSAYFNWERDSSLICTRQYRAPEVFLGLDWTYSSDIWSIGCILAEMYDGDQLFPSRTDYEHVHMIEQRTGMFPSHMVHGSPLRDELFDSDGVVNVQIQKQRKVKINLMRGLESFVAEADSETGFADILMSCLLVNPEIRISAEECRNLPFFHNSL